MTRTPTLARPAPAPSATTVVQLRGLGFAVPERRWSQSRITETMIDAWGLRGSAAERFRRIAVATGIETRHAVLPLEQVVRLTTAQRMEAYEAASPDLATSAAADALGAAGIAPDAVTDLVVVSCTGFSAPGLDVALVERLGLPPEVRRTSVGFMGCYGGIVGLRTAVGACLGASLETSGGVALVVCLELCSLHLRDDRDLQNQVASAPFADGAAAAVVTRTAAPTHEVGEAIGRLSYGRSRLLIEGSGWMSWRVTDRGFRMTLSREVPAALRGAIRGFVETDDRDAAAPTLVVHPGGPEILDAVEDALTLEPGRGLEHSREVLRRYGNMSSTTVLFVLDEALRAGARLPMLLMAFGPGLAIESLRLEEDR